MAHVTSISPRLSPVLPETRTVHNPSGTPLSQQTAPLNVTAVPVQGTVSAQGARANADALMQKQNQLAVMEDGLRRIVAAISPIPAFAVVLPEAPQGFMRPTALLMLLSQIEARLNQAADAPAAIADISSVSASDILDLDGSRRHIGRALGELATFHQQILKEVSAVERNPKVPLEVTVRKQRRDCIDAYEQAAREMAVTLGPVLSGPVLNAERLVLLRQVDASLRKMTRERHQLLRMICPREKSHVMRLAKSINAFEQGFQFKPDASAPLREQNDWRKTMKLVEDSLRVESNASWVRPAIAAAWERCVLSIELSLSVSNSQLDAMDAGQRKQDATRLMEALEELNGIMATSAQVSDTYDMHDEPVERKVAIDQSAQAQRERNVAAARVTLAEHSSFTNLTDELPRRLEEIHRYGQAAVLTLLSYLHNAALSASERLSEEECSSERIQHQTARLGRTIEAANRLEEAFIDACRRDLTPDTPPAVTQMATFIVNELQAHRSVYRYAAAIGEIYAARHARSFPDSLLPGYGWKASSLQQALTKRDARIKSERDKTPEQKEKERLRKKEQKQRQKARRQEAAAASSTAAPEESTLSAALQQQLATLSLAQTIPGQEPDSSSQTQASSTAGTSPSNKKKRRPAGKKLDMRAPPAASLAEATPMYTEKTADATPPEDTQKTAQNDHPDYETSLDDFSAESLNLAIQHAQPGAQTLQTLAEEPAEKEQKQGKPEKTKKAGKQPESISVSLSLVENIRPAISKAAAELREAQRCLNGIEGTPDFMERTILVEKGMSAASDAAGHYFFIGDSMRKASRPELGIVTLEQAEQNFANAMNLAEFFGIWLASDSSHRPSLTLLLTHREDIRASIPDDDKFIRPFAKTVWQANRSRVLVTDRMIEIRLNFSEVRKSASTGKTYALPPFPVWLHLHTDPDADLSVAGLRRLVAGAINAITLKDHFDRRNGAFYEKRTGKKVERVVLEEEQIALEIFRQMLAGFSDEELAARLMLDERFG